VTYRDSAVTHRTFGFAVCVTALFAFGAVAVIAQQKPEIRLSATSAKLGEVINLSGAGFTPERSALSHLLKPDGTEYNPLRMRINASGELVHKIDTVMLEVGVYEVWIVDETTGAVSNRIRFTTTE